jgi:TPR repeat protein
MFRSAISQAICLIVFLVVAPVFALAQAKDVWTYQTPGDKFYFDAFDTAAILQSDGTVALLAFPKGGTTMNAHIGFFANGFVPSIKSMLIDADGTARSVIVDGDNLKRGELNENNFISYHYVLNESDMPLFQHASLWRIETSAQSVSYSLKGSRAALDQVMAARETRKSANDGDGFKAYMVNDCDTYAAHPNDENSAVPGVAWGDLNGKEAVESCEIAVVLNDDNPRMHYQLGRAYDKVRNPKALSELKKAAIDMRYPAAFNHLGLLYWDGDYTMQDFSNARDLFEQGMEMGNISSKYNYARILVREGDGGSDLLFAQVYLKDLADSGHILSQRKYGEWSADGSFGVRRPEVARVYLDQAAGNNDADAAYILSQMYLGGQGLEANPTLHLIYLKLAAVNGHAKAKAELGFN